MGRIRKYLPPNALQRFVNPLAISHLDYCNSLLYGLSSSELAKFQIKEFRTNCGRASIWTYGAYSQGHALVTHTYQTKIQD